MTTFNGSNSPTFMNFENLGMCHEQPIKPLYCSYSNTEEKEKKLRFERKTSLTLKSSTSPLHQSISFLSQLVALQQGAVAYPGCLTLKAEVALWRSWQLIDDADWKTMLAANFHSSLQNGLAMSTKNVNGRRGENMQTPHWLLEIKAVTLVLFGWKRFHLSNSRRVSVTAVDLVSFPVCACACVSVCVSIILVPAEP